MEEKRFSKFKIFDSNKLKSVFTLRSPSIHKRQKNGCKFSASSNVADESSYRKHETCLENSYSSESIYSQIEDLETKTFSKIHSKDLACESLNSKFSTNDDLCLEKINSRKHDTTLKEPLYATVKKKLILAERQSENYEENNTFLRDRIKNISEENRHLRQKLQDFLKEEKRKEDSLHSELQLKITELETETRKDVKFLTDRIRNLIKEKEILNDQIDILQKENKSTRTKYEDLYNSMKHMVSLDVHRKTITDNQKLMNDVKNRHTEDMENIKKQYNIIKESNISLQNRVEELQNKLTAVDRQIEILEDTNHNLHTDKNNLLGQVEETKNLEREMQNILLSLLKVTENFAVEKNVLLTKTTFHDHQQKEIQSAVIDYSLNIGRLQEHILNLNKDNHQEMIQLATNKYLFDENLHQLCEKQSISLQEKIIAQNMIIKELESNKRILESQLELIWQAACGTNSKLLEDVKALL